MQTPKPKIAVSLKLPSAIVKGLKDKALENALPYQTLIRMILKQFVEGRLQTTDLLKSKKT